MSKKELARQEEKSSSSMIILIIAASFAAVAYLQSDMVEKLVGINLKKMIHGEEAKRSISSVQNNKKNKNSKLPSPETQGTGKIIMGGVDISMEVYVNGVKTEYMGRPIKADLDQETVVVVKKQGYVPYVSKVSLSKDKNSTVINVPELERARMGLLTTSQNYTAGSKLIYEEAGERVERDLPFKNIEIPEGTYQARVVNPILGTEKRVEFIIEENKKHFLE